MLYRRPHPFTSRPAREALGTCETAVNPPVFSLVSGLPSDRHPWLKCSKCKNEPKTKGGWLTTNTPSAPMQVSGQELRFDRKLIFGEPVPATHADGKCEHLESVAWLIECPGFWFGGTQIAELAGAVVLPKIGLERCPPWLLRAGWWLKNVIHRAGYSLDFGRPINSANRMIDLPRRGPRGRRAVTPTALFVNDRWLLAVPRWRLGNGVAVAAARKGCKWQTRSLCWQSSRTRPRRMLRRRA
jgi:hypothetical protein